MSKLRRDIGREHGGGERLFVDSGAWIALVSASDRHHAEAEQMFRQAMASRIPLFTTNLVIAEVHRLLLFRAGIRAAARVIDRIDAGRSLRVEFAGQGHHERARAWLARLDDQRISYTDAVSFAVMETARCTAAISFDSDFAIAGFRLWQVQ